VVLMHEDRYLSGFHHRRHQPVSHETRTISAHLTEFLVSSVVIAVLFVLGDLVSVYVFNPIQAVFFPQLTELASLLFLPHGIRVLATVLLGLRAAPGLVAGTAFVLFYVYGVRDVQLLIWISLISGCVPWIVLRCMRSFGINAFYLKAQDGMPPFDNILTAGIICSVANGFLTTSMLELKGTITQVSLTMAAYTVGDVTGLIASWLLSNAILKFFTSMRK